MMESSASASTYVSFPRRRSAASTREHVVEPAHAEWWLGAPEAKPKHTDTPWPMSLGFAGLLGEADVVSAVAVEVADGEVVRGALGFDGVLGEAGMPGR